MELFEWRLCIVTLQSRNMSEVRSGRLDVQQQLCIAV